MNIGFAVTQLGNTSVTLSRASASVSRASDGFAAAITRTDSTIRAVVWDPTPKELQGLPEGMRTRAVKALLTTTELIAAEDPAGRPGDVLTIGGVTYTVYQTENWSAYGYYKSVAFA